MWHYQKSEAELWTVGHYGEGGKWQPESDWPSSEQAAERTAYLNGGGVASIRLLHELEGALERETRLRQQGEELGRTDRNDIRSHIKRLEQALGKLETRAGRDLELLTQLDCRTIDNGRQLAELGEKLLELEGALHRAPGRALSLVGLLEGATELLSERLRDIPAGTARLPGGELELAREAVKDEFDRLEHLAQIDGPAQPERRAAARVNRETWRRELGTALWAAWAAAESRPRPGSAEQAIAASPAAQRLAAYIERLEDAGFPPGTPMPAYPAIPGVDVTQ